PRPQPGLREYSGRAGGVAAAVRPRRHRSRHFAGCALDRAQRLSVMAVESGTQDTLGKCGLVCSGLLRCEPFAIKGVKERRLLGLLLSRANSVVPVDSIFEALWGTEPPPSAAKSVQVYAVRVRKMLEPNGRPTEGSLVSRRGAGYMLRAARDQVDALRFADLVARAREAAAAGSDDIAAQVLREALGLWRGSAYADFQDTLFGAAEAARLEEMRLVAVEARVDADLALGRHAEVVAELESLVREHPLRERLWAQLMIAFYRG